MSLLFSLNTKKFYFTAQQNKPKEVNRKIVIARILPVIQLDVFIAFKNETEFFCKNQDLNYKNGTLKFLWPIMFL